MGSGEGFHCMGLGFIYPEYVVHSGVEVGDGGGFSCGATIFSEACQPIHWPLTQEDRYVSGF